MTTPALKAALRTKFCVPEWALFFEVGDATGGRQRRWADAVAMNLYPSRGLTIEGFEVKAYRSDWLRELKNPEKSAPVQQYCNHWWIVSTPDVVKPEELPPTWGLLELKGNGLRTIKAAPPLTPTPVTREFVAAMLRRASEVDDGEVKATVAKEVERIRAMDQPNIERQIERRTRDMDTVMKKVAEIKQHCGIDLLYGYDDPAAIGRAMRLVLDSGVVGGKYSPGIKGLSEQLARAKENIDKALQAFELPPIETPKDAA